MAWSHRISLLAVALALGACTPVPPGPSVMALPGAGKPLEQFQVDDGACRQWAADRVGGSAEDPWIVQRRYDIAYLQCMYARGNDLPGLMRPGRLPSPSGPVGPPPDPPPPPPTAPSG